MFIRTLAKSRTNLARIESKTVEVTSYVRFVESLYSRREFPPPVNHWEKVAEKQDAA